MLLSESENELELTANNSRIDISPWAMYNCLKEETDSTKN